MTLSTDIYIRGTGVTQREVYEKVNDLLGIPEIRLFAEGPNDWKWTPGDHRIANEIGQGFPAIVATYGNADGSEVVLAHDDDCEADCAYHAHVTPHHIHVDLDTAYSYRDERGWGCSELHGWVIAALIDWLAPKGCTLHWVDEYAGTLHAGKEHLESFIGNGAEADAWFRMRALPAMLAEAVSR